MKSQKKEIKRVYLSLNDYNVESYDKEEANMCLMANMCKHEKQFNKGVKGELDLLYFLFL